MRRATSAWEIHSTAELPTDLIKQRPLPRSFYERPTVEVARDLLGCILLYQPADAALRAARLVEVEAYLGESDRAAHSWHGYTKRTAPMYEEAGHAYIYLIYGMYWCLNVVTEAAGTPTAVLIRAAEPIANIERPTDGPGKLCRAFGIDGRMNRADLTDGPLQIIPAEPVPDADVAATPRIGVAYAGEWAAKPLRFLDHRSAWVSHQRKSPSNAR